MFGRKYNESVPKWVIHLVNFSLGFTVSSSTDNDTLDPSFMPSKRCKEVSDDKNESKLTAVKNELHERDGVSSEKGSIEMEQMSSTHPTSSEDGSNVSADMATTTSPKSAYSWERGSRALDRICRVIIPLCYVIFVSIAIGTRV